LAIHLSFEEWLMKTVYTEGSANFGFAFRVAVF
jgi:hypothetical protein